MVQSGAVGFGSESALPDLRLKGFVVQGSALI